MQVRDDEEWEQGDGQEAGELTFPRSPFSAGRARRRIRVTPFGTLLVAGALVLGVGTGWLVNGRDGAARSDAPATAPAAAPAGTPATARTPATTPAPATPAPPVTPATSATSATSATPTVPPDFAVVRDPSGVTLAVPAGWRRSAAASVYYRSSGAPYSRYLQFRRLPDRDVSATGALRTAVAPYRRLPGFELEALHPTGRGTAELRYSYDSGRAGQRLTFLQRVFTAEDGRRYLFAVAGPAADWPRQRTLLTAALAPFAVS
ncbi:hypothetical protein [Streptomyces sp. NPDC058657]|uniref:hypothetical protein n=1 Tax=unclassified Streptomyces TaxID=2593676 RepID=UPI00365916DC